MSEKYSSSFREKDLPAKTHQSQKVASPSWHHADYLEWLASHEHNCNKKINSLRQTFTIFHYLGHGPQGASSVNSTKQIKLDSWHLKKQHDDSCHSRKWGERLLKKLNATIKKIKSISPASSQLKRYLNWNKETVFRVLTLVSLQSKGQKMLRGKMFN